MKKMRKALLVLATGATVLGLGVLCSACDTTAWTNLASYFDNLGEILGSDDSSGSTTTTTTKTQLDTPSSFSISEDGTYSFSGVDNASAYIMYAYASSDSENAAYTKTIEADGSSTYTGNMSDLFSFAYDAYTIELVAYASRTSSYSDSDGVQVSYTVTGELSAPQIEYSWDGETMTFQLANSTDYASEVTPDSVVLTVTNDDDGSVITLTFDADDIDTSSDYNYVETTELEIGYSYTVTAVAYSSSKYVTSSSSETSTVFIDTLTSEEVESDGYSEQSIGGGSFTLSSEVTDVSIADMTLTVYGGNVYIECALTANDTVTDGSVYSYTFKGSNNGDAVTGTMELAEDGTVTIVVNAFGPFSKYTQTATWEEVDGAIVVTL